MPDISKDEVPSEQSAVESLLERLQNNVAERRTAGQYPEDLIEQLDAHFRRMVFHRVDHDASYLIRELEALDSSSAFNRGRISSNSSMPGGNQLHALVNKAVSRQTDGVLQQMQQFADDVRQILRSLVLAVQDGSIHVHTDLVSRIDSVLERLDSYERAPVHNGAALGDLRRRIEELERAEASRGFKPWFTNDSFEQQFRGTKDELRDRYVDLSAVLKDVPGPIVDFGCGRGEFMELLRGQGNKTWGIEIDPALALIAAQAELDVKTGDGMKILANVDDDSLGGITLIQVIEHLSQQQQLDLIATAFAKLKTGGKLVIETINPQSIYVYAHAFYLDPTHTRPVHPAYMEFLQKEIGFSEVLVDWRNPPPANDQLEATGEEASDRNVVRLNQLLFASSDYATIATK